MSRVILTDNLGPYTGGVREAEVSGARVRDLIAALDERIPGLLHYLVDDQGALRPHVNIFVDGEAVRDRSALSDTVREESVVHILQAVSGG